MDLCFFFSNIEFNLNEVLLLCDVINLTNDTEELGVEAHYFVVFVKTFEDALTSLVHVEVMIGTSLFHNKRKWNYFTFL